jgi:hypothetical protein
MLVYQIQDSNVVFPQIAYVDDFAADVGLYFAKFSLLALYYDLISIAFTKLRIALHIITIYVVIGCIITCCFDLFWCIPISDNW